jgi:hypothetical protein
VNGRRHGYAVGVTRKTRTALALLRPARYGPEVRPVSAVAMQSRGATAIGALGVGAFAIGALAIGRLAIRRAVIEQLTARETRLGRVEIDELVVRRLHVVEDVSPRRVPPPAPPPG